MEAPEFAAPPGMAAPGTGLKHTNKENVPELPTGGKAHAEQRRSSLAPWAAPAQTPSKMAELRSRCARWRRGGRSELSLEGLVERAALAGGARPAAGSALRRAAPRRRSHDTR